ncbi:MAG: exonuclease SbcCD subunit D, partial [Patescibacteria group bacterium]
TAKKEKVDLVLFAGDAFKTREPSPTYQRAFAQKIYEFIAAGIPVVFLVGNHDFPGALGKAHTLEIYPTLFIPKIFVLAQDEIKIIPTKKGPIQVAGLPWYSRQQLLLKDDLRLPIEKINLKVTESLEAKIKQLSKNIDPKMPAILLAHATVSGATYGSERSVMIGSDVVIPIEVFKKSPFNYIGLGHLHKHQVLQDNPPIIYSGSIERIDFGEEKEDKGFILGKIIFDKQNKHKTNWQFIKTPARKFITIKANISSDEKDPTKKVLDKIDKENITDAVVKIIIESSLEKSAEISENRIRNKLVQANFIAGIIKEINVHERKQIHPGFSDELASLDPLGLLEKYLIVKKINKSHQHELVTSAQKLIEENL